MGPDEKPASHCEVYLRVMDESGTDTAMVKRVLDKLDPGEQWPVALKEVGVLPGIADVVRGTLHSAIHRSVVEVAS
jgi:hypothetical protein